MEIFVAREVEVSGVEQVRPDIRIQVVDPGGPPKGGPIAHVVEGEEQGALDPELLTEYLAELQPGMPIVVQCEGTQVHLPDFASLIDQADNHDRSLAIWVVP